jgi:hypothetical protein
MRRGTLFAVAVFGLCASASVMAQSGKKGDPALTAQLDRLGLHYTITSSGNYSITYDLDGGRTQIAYIMGKTDSVGDTAVRELWSRAGTFDDVPSTDDMQGLLEDSGSRSIGFWALEEADNGGYNLYFSVKVPVYLKDADLARLLDYTASAADQKEEELFNQDEE